MKRWNERLAFGVIGLVFLALISIVQGGIDDDEGRVAFLKWIDNQEAYQDQVLQRIIMQNEERSQEEMELFDGVESLGASLYPDFPDFQVSQKWDAISRSEFQPLYESFLNLVREKKVSFVESEIEWADPDVGANVGALVLGFRKLIADMLWLKVDEYWHLGLVERMLPMMETVVMLDPHFIEAYALGAWHLAYNVTVMFPSKEDKMKYVWQGIKLLERGIKKNPRSSKLYADLGYMLYFRKMADWEKAAYYLGEASRYEHDPWVERAYALALERLGKEETALAVLKDYNKRFPDFVVHRLAMARLDKKLQARKLEHEGRLVEAAEVWRFLKNDDPTDIIAPREVLRLEAILKGDPTGSPEVSASIPEPSF